MADDDQPSSSSSEDSILYDVAYQVEWPVDKEFIGGSQQDDIPIYSNVQSVRSSISKWAWTTVRAVGFPVRTGAPCMLSHELVKLINSQESWLLARSPDGDYIAILQDTCLEIRSSKEEYNSIIGRCMFSKDSQPQWRKVAWNLQSTMIGFSDSDGTVHVCDLRGIVVLSFHGHQRDELGCFDYGTAISSLTFVENNKIAFKDDSTLLMIVTYSGAASFLELNEAYQDGYKVKFKFDFSSCHTKGVSCVLYHKDHDIFFVGGCTGYGVDDEGVPRATKYGMTAWRLLSDEPYLKSLDAFIDVGDSRGRISIFRRLSTVPSGLGKKLRGQVVDGVYLMALSPCHKLLATVHFSGSLSLWEVPSLRHKRMWRNEEQPFYGDLQTDDSKTLNTATKRSKPYQMLHNIIDCQWWSDTALVLARCSGSVTVVRVTGITLENLFGSQCEWFEPAPRLSSCKEEGFLAMECETVIKSLKRQRDDSVEEAPREDGVEYDPFLDDSDNEESPGISERLKNYSKSTMYNLTEIEYFRPPRKRPKLVTKSYRLLAISKTTPEKLFEKKLEDEEYGEALALAQRYNLEGDKVFQRQWRKSPVSVASIQDYLSKVTKRSWVLHECCERVPEELDAARELLKFALRVTDIDKLSTDRRDEINTDANEDSDSDYEEYEGFSVEEQRNQEIRQRNKFVRKWSKIFDFEKLTLEQKEMIRVRKKIFKYLDRLSTYEYLLGGYDAARERYNSGDFSDFRQKSIFVSSIEYARNGNWKAVDTLWTFHGDELREHRLPILSNFPKTLLPSEYKSLIPFITNDSTVSIWPEVKHRDPEDWCETEEYQNAISPLTHSNDASDEFYNEIPALSQFRTPEPTAELIKKWFLHQSIQMDNDARDIEGALDLLAIGQENGLEGLKDLTRDFKTLETLVYDCDYDPALTLVKLQQKPKLEQLGMLLKNSSKEMYIKNFHRWGLPFLNSCNDIESANDILKKYVLELAEEDLCLPTLIFTSFLVDHTLPATIMKLEDLANLALESVYVNSNPLQLKLVKQVHGVLSKLDKFVLNKMKNNAAQKIAELEYRIYACSVFADSGVNITPDSVREVENDRSKVQKLLVRLSRKVGGREPPLNKNEWNHLLQRMLQLRNKVFSKTCNLESAVCLEIFVESLLTSGNINNFKIAGEHMMRTADEEHEATRRRLYSSSQQKLSYESSVDLVIKSSQEYFDASMPNSNDNMLSLSRECLLLITDRPPSIHERLDLIEGVVLLQRFNVDELPLQVRIKEDRLSLIKKALDGDDEAYRKTEPLLRLAMLLRISGKDKDERKGMVLTMIIEKALSCDDIDSAYCLCQELINMSYTPAWEVCLKLACLESFPNIIAKRDILAFVACYCDSLKLVQVMEKMNELNAGILQAAVRERKSELQDGIDEIVDESDRTESPTVPRSFENLSEGNLNPLNKFVHTSADFLSPSKMLQQTALGTKAMLSVTGNVLSATSSTTKTVLTNVGNAEWWRSQIDKTLSVIPSVEISDVNDFQTNQEVVVNEDFEQHCCPEFYTGLIKGSVSKYGLLIGSEQYIIPQQIAINQAIFRALQLENKIEMDDVESSCLENLIADTLPYDFALGLSYLLVVLDPDEASRYLKKLPVSAFSLQLSLYYFSLRFFAERGNDVGSDNKSSIYNIPPLELIKQAVMKASKCEYQAGSRLYKIVNHLVQIKEELFDFSQGEKLQNLGRGIDLSRFTKDNEYKEETILGLSMTKDVEQYKLAVSLAHRSGTDLWLVLITQLEFLFTECQGDFDAAALHERIRSLNLVPELIKKPIKFFERMDKHIYPFIGGQEYDRLILYYSLLSQCKGEEKSFKSVHEVCNIPASEHVKMLRKIKTTTTDLDYKILVSDGENQNVIIQILRPILNGNNVPMFVKMMSSLPYSNFKISSSMLYLEVAKKTMWMDVNEESRISINWVSKYESCVGYLRMCYPNDLLMFFDELLFSLNGSKIIPLGSRQDIVKRAVKLAKNQGMKERKNQLENSVLAAGQSFQSVLPTLIQMSKHLDSYSTTFVSDLIKNSTTDDRMLKYMEAYDKSQSRPELIMDLAVMMLCDGCDLTFLQNFFAVVPGNKWTCLNVLETCIDSIVNGFSVAGDQHEKAFGKLENVIGAISIHEKSRGKILTSTQVIGLLRPFCSDSSFEAKLRVDVLKLLEDQFQLEASEAKLLMLHRTEAVVREGWGDEICEQYMKQFGADGITNDSTRYELFRSLLQLDTCDVTKAKHLVTLLTIWPDFESVDLKNESWRGALLKFTQLGSGGGKELVDIVKTKLKDIDTSIWKDVFRKLLECKQSFYAIKLCLLADLSDLQDEMLEVIGSVTQMGPSQCDEELIVLMLEKSVAVRTVGTLYYSKIAEYLLSGDCPDSEGHVHRLARQLPDLGHMAEAGTLLLNFRGTHPALRTFSNALSSLKRWLNT